MSTERERDEDKQDKKKGIAEIIKAAFKELVAKIEELLGKGQRTPEEEAALNQLETERNRRTKAFFEHPFGQETQRIANGIENRLKATVDEIRNASEAELSDKARNFQRVLAEEKERARRQGIKETEAGLPAELLGIAEDQLSKKINTQVTAFNEEGARRAQAASADRPQTQHRNRRGETPEEVFEQMGRELNLPQEHIENTKKHMAALGGRSYFTPAEIALLTFPGKRGEDLREQKFNEILGVVDSNPALRFYEALDLETSTKLAQFRLLLTKIEGEKGTQIIQEYMTKIKMSMMLHDAVWVVEQGAGKPEDFQKMMEMFTPELFDQLFKYEGVEMAAHLYEQGLEMVRSRNDNFPPYEYLVSNPKNDNKCYLDDWVKARLEEIMREKKGTDYKWGERDIRRVMALGKGYEMATLRMQEMVARGRLPDYMGPPSQLQSPYAEDFVRPLDPFEHLIEKFLTGDPGAMWSMFVITGGTVLPGSSREEIDRLISQKGVNPNALRMIDMVNFLHIGGPFSSSGWRGAIAMEDLPDETKAKWMGLAFRLAQAKSLAEKEDISEAEMKRKIFEEELQRNPMRILREAELQDGEILNLDVQANILEETLKQLYSGAELDQKIEELAAVRKEHESDKDFATRIRKAKNARTVFLDKAESPLVFLTQIEADKDMGRKGKIDFSKLSTDQRRYAEAYFKSIDKVVHEQGMWKDKEGQQKNLIEFLAQKEFPFAPGLDDTPWSELKFIKMGQKGFARRMRDYKGAYSAMMGMLHLQDGFGMMRKAEDYVKGVDEIWRSFREYDKDLAKKKVGNIYEGIATFNAGNSWRRFLPIPLDYIADEFPEFFPSIVKPTSYAKEAFGHSANSWRAPDIRHFLMTARAAGHITEEQELELRRKLRCTAGWMVLEFVSRTWIFAPALIAITFLKELLEQLQEQAKEA